MAEGIRVVARQDGGSAIVPDKPTSMKAGESID